MVRILLEIPFSTLPTCFDPASISAQAQTIFLRDYNFSGHWSFFYVCRDAEDAVYGRDGYDYDGYRLRVEFPRSGRGGGRGGGGGVGAPRGRYGPPSRRSEYRVIVSGEGMGSITSLSCNIGCFHTWSKLEFNCSHPLDFTLYFFKFISNHGMSVAVFFTLVNR